MKRVFIIMLIMSILASCKTDKILISNPRFSKITIDTLFQENASFSAALRNDTIVFFTGTGKIKDKFDIYSTTAKTWSIGILPFRINESDIFSSNNSLFVAGGKLFNEKYYDKLWKLDF